MRFKVLFTSLASAVLTVMASGNIAMEWALMPAPQSVKPVKGKSLSPVDLRYIECTDTDMPVLYDKLDRLPRTHRAGAGVSLSIDTVSTPLSDEGYRMAVSAEGVTVKSRSGKGLFYGCITLGQLLEQSEDTGRPIPPMVIEDWPAVSFRAVHFDSKHHLDRIEYYYDLIDRLASWKVNAVIWEIEDKMQYERRPECSAPNAISKQEMQAICRYARDRHVEINPLIQGLGHAAFILKHHWELRENPLSDWEFCPSDPRTYDLQFDLYRDAIEAMPYSRYLHIGGDEITAIGVDERCRATGKTPFELQMYWLDKVCDFAVANGRIPVFWDDMPLKYGGVWDFILDPKDDSYVEKNWSTDSLDKAIDMFPRECVYMRWNYDDPTPLAHIKLLDWYSRHGLKVLGATAVNQGSDVFIPRRESNAGNIREFCRLVADNGLEGIFATNWEDGSPHWETVMRGFAALGEYGWNPVGREVSQFKRVHSMREFGLRPDGTAFIDSLEQSAFFFDGALVTEGRRNPAYQVYDFKLVELPDGSDRGRWSQEHSKLLNEARRQAERCGYTRAAIADALGNALRNRYTLEIYNQLNNLFEYPATILLALEQYDNAVTPADLSIARDRLKEVCDSFTTLRHDFEETYSRTRFMTYPNGYVADLNHHHHLASRTPDSSWIYLYELPFINAVRTKLL